eukprot:966648-Pyramimonas_sp.AAC.1
MGPYPVPPNWPDVLEAPEQQGGQRSLNRSFGKFVGLLEDELIGAHGIPEKQQARFRGRGLGWKYTRLPGFAPTPGPCSVASQEALGWRRVANWL